MRHKLVQGKVRGEVDGGEPDVERSLGKRPLTGALQRKLAQPYADGPLAAGVELSEGIGGEKMPSDVQAKMENALGADFSDVRIHVDGQADRIGAQAFAAGNNLHFAQGKYDPSAATGQEILGHELTHVVQQRSGRVNAPAAEGGNATLFQDPALEAEADALGARAAASDSSVSTAQPKLTGGGGGGLIQGKMVAQGIAPALAAIGAALVAKGSAEAAATVSAIIALGTAAVQAGAAIAPGSTGVQTIQLESWTSDQDKIRLEQITLFRLINAYVAQWKAAHPNDPLTTTTSPTTSTTTSTTTTSPPRRQGGATTTTGTATTTGTSDAGPAKDGGQVDEAIMAAVKATVQSQVTTALNASQKSVDSQEFIWSDSGDHTADWFGTVGAIQLRGVMGAGITETLQLSPDAASIPNLVVPSAGTSVQVRQFRGGRLVRGASMETGMNDELAINVVGAAPSKDEAANGEHGKVTVATEWTWDDNATQMEVDITISANGQPEISQARYHGEPED